MSNPGEKKCHEPGHPLHPSPSSTSCLCLFPRFFLSLSFSSGLSQEFLFLTSSSSHNTTLGNNCFAKSQMNGESLESSVVINQMNENKYGCGLWLGGGDLGHAYTPHAIPHHPTEE